MRSLFFSSFIGILGLAVFFPGFSLEAFAKKAIHQRSKLHQSAKQRAIIDRTWGAYKGEDLCERQCKFDAVKLDLKWDPRGKSHRTCNMIDDICMRWTKTCMNRAMYDGCWKEAQARKAEDPATYQQYCESKWYHKVLFPPVNLVEARNISANVFCDELEKKKKG